MSGKTQRWTPERVAELAAVLGRSSSLGGGLAEASQVFGFDVNRTMADCALKRAGYGTAHSLVGRAPEVEVDIPVDWDEPHPADDEPATLPGSQPVPVGWAFEAPLERILFIPDCHFPYVDRLAWALMLQCARRFRPHRIVVLGDFLDFYMVSDHDKDPRRVSQLADEVAEGNAALDELDALGADKRHFIAGNHEARLSRYLTTRAPALLDTVKLEELLHLGERGWTYTPFLESLRIGDLAATHACENAGMNAHRQAAGLFMGSVVIGHTHRIAVDQFGAHGRSHTASMFGWLGSAPEATYLSTARKARYWSLGFGLGWMAADGTVHTQAVPIVDYTAVVNGEVVRLARAA